MFKQDAERPGLHSHAERGNDKNPVNIGKGFWTGMFTFGATYYFDEEKTWHLAVLNRYEINSRKQGIDIQPGDDFHVEWGLGKTLAKNLNVGIRDVVIFEIPFINSSYQPFARAS